ncbi:SRPBCC domain-containing protein [Streptomyces sp. NPDC006984]|uniref:SRPBCC family protein n=1 Tax=Streptomyces sp. NPDC006984 TaxID=3155463 RepID=UPI0033FE9A1D
MEHEAFVPVPAETLRQALRDPARVARCVPGLQRDADAEAGPLSGRLKLRVANHSITYRGELHLVEQGRAFVVEGEGTEVRGGGSVKITLAIRPEPTDGGTTLTFTGSARAEGRLAELPAGPRTAAGHRILDRFAESLAAAAFEEPPLGGAQPPRAGEAAAGAAGTDGPRGTEGPDGGQDAGNGGPAEGRGTEDAAGELGASGAVGDRDPHEAAEPGAEDGGPGTVEPPIEDPDPAPGAAFDVPVPPPSLGPDTEDAFDDGSDDDVDGEARPFPDEDDEDDGDDVVDLDGLGDLQDVEGFRTLGDPDAEAAHARRTMIGRSAEEVDHAPPRGRYAPTPAPAASGSGAALRWIAPAAALALASAVVVSRILRRRG